MSLNVLVVDDSAVMRAMIIKTLRLSGVPLSEIYQAPNGKEALGVVEAHWIDLALVDLNMPVMSGEEFIDKLKENPGTENLPVIVVSTEGSQTRIAKLQKQGVAFVHKPFTPEDLRTAILNLTGVECDEQIGDGALSSSGPDF